MCLYICMYVTVTYIPYTHSQSSSCSIPFGVYFKFAFRLSTIVTTPPLLFIQCLYALYVHMYMFSCIHVCVCVHPPHSLRKLLKAGDIHFHLDKYDIPHPLALPSANLRFPFCNQNWNSIVDIGLHSDPSFYSPLFIRLHLLAFYWQCQTIVTSFGIMESSKKQKFEAEIACN